MAGRFWSIVYRLISSGLHFKLDDRIKAHPLSQKISEESTDDEFFRALYKEFKKIRASSGPALQKVIEDIGSRYLSVKFQDVGFPLDPPAGNHIAAFLFAIIPYCFINLSLLLILDTEKKITKADIIDVIYRTERIVQHTRRVYKSIIDNQEILHIDKFEACMAELL